MTRPTLVLLVMALLLVLAACAESTDSVTPLTEAITTTSAPSTTPPPSTATTVPPATEASTTTTVAVDSVLAPIPRHPGLLWASPDVPWDEIGPGWLLFDFVAAHDIEEEGWDEAPLVLYLQDEDGNRYGVGRWEDPWIQVLDWSSANHEVLALHGIESGGEHAGYELWLVDLRSGERTVLLEADPGAWVSAGFHAPEDEFVVVRIVLDDRADIVLLDGTGEQLAELLSSHWDAEEYDDPESVYPTWASIGDGGVVVADREGIRVVSLAGETIRELQTPGMGCEVARAVGAAVFVSCTNPEYAASPCWAMWGGEGHRELWSVWTAGDDASPIYLPPLPDAETCDGYDPYHDALPLSEFEEQMLLETAGCCECGGRLDLLDATGIRPVDFDDVALCAPEIVAADPHGEGFIVHDWPTPREEGRFGTLLRVAADGTFGGFVTPLMPGYGGVVDAWAGD